MIGTILSQNNKPIAYFSEKISSARMRYSTYDVKFYALVQVIKHYHDYLFHREFVLYTDHEALKHLHWQDKGSSRHDLWVAYLKSFTIVMKHKLGATYRVVDVLSYRKILLTMTHIKVPGFDSFCEIFAYDPYFLVFWLEL